LLIPFYLCIVCDLILEARRRIHRRKVTKKRMVAKRRVARKIIARRQLMLSPIEFDKYVAVYGAANVNGVHEIRRWEIAGPGRSVYEAVKIAVMYPPKKRFSTIWAEDLVNYPHRFIGRGYWIGREVESG
jgi:hypothetical protein